MQSSVWSQNKLELIIHFRDQHKSLIAYRGTSEQAILQNIRELTNLHRFQCLNQQQQPLILSSNLPNNTHIYIKDPSIVEEKSDEVPPQQQIDYLKSKIYQIIDPKNMMNVFKSMLMVVEAPPPPLPSNDENKDRESGDHTEDQTETQKENGDENGNENENENEKEKEKQTEDDDKDDHETQKEEETKDEEQKEKETEIETETEAEIESKEEQKEPDDPSIIKYKGKYQALIREIETKSDVLRQIALKMNGLSEDEDLVAPKQEENQEKDEETETELEKEKEEALLEKVMAKLNDTNLQNQIQQMQQLLQMQQTTMMAMIAAGTGNGNMNMNTMSNPMPLTLNKAHGLTQSATDEADEMKQETVPEVNRSAEYKKWFAQSKLVEDDEYDTLLSFFDGSGKAIRNIELIYRGSDEGFDAYKFHEKCDDVDAATLIMIESEHNHVFGGFTTQSWKDESPSKAGQWKVDPEAFIYILRSPKDDVLPERWKVLAEKKEKTIRCDMNYGPTFGYGYDIRICTECDQKKDSSSQLDNEDACFGAPQDDDYLTGEFYFLVKDYEVYKVNM